jgi:hypothetical protein
LTSSFVVPYASLSTRSLAWFFDATRDVNAR